jgi:hypothetical protein
LRTQPVSASAGERVLICKAGPPEAVDRAMLATGGGSRVETVSTLAEGLALCLNDRIDHLIVNMFSFTSDELTSLMVFRDRLPRQRVMIFCPEEAISMLAGSGLADECHAITTAKGAYARARRPRSYE